MFGLSKKELGILSKLKTPIQIQNHLDTIPMNWEKDEETYMSPRLVLRKGKAHCFEGALLAAAALWLSGRPPLLLDLKAPEDEFDHVVTLYKENGYWGAISKTNHATLRFRDPVYKTLRELALSYFHEYTDDRGSKTLRRISKPFDLRKLGNSWITTEENLEDIVQQLDDSPHQDIIPKINLKYIRNADSMEIKAGKLIEWKKSDSRC